MTMDEDWMPKYVQAVWQATRTYTKNFLSVGNDDDEDDEDNGTSRTQYVYVVLSFAYKSNRTHVCCCCKLIYEWKLDEISASSLSLSTQFLCGIVVTSFVRSTMKTMNIRFGVYDVLIKCRRFTGE